PARALAVNALLTGTPTEAAATAISLGLPVQGAFRVALSAAELGAGSLQRALGSQATVHEGGSVDGADGLLIQLRADAPDTVRRSGTRRSDPMAGLRAAVRSGWLTLSAPTAGVAGIAEATRQARYVRSLLAARLIAGPVGRFESLDDLGAYRLLYPLW